MSEYIERLPLLWNGKFEFDSESGQATDFKLNIHSFNDLRSWEEQAYKLICCVVGKNA